MKKAFLLIFFSLFAQSVSFSLKTLHKKKTFAVIGIGIIAGIFVDYLIQKNESKRDLQFVEDIAKNLDKNLVNYLTQENKFKKNFHFVSKIAEEIDKKEPKLIKNFIVLVNNKTKECFYYSPCNKHKTPFVIAQNNGSPYLVCLKRDSSDHFSQLIQKENLPKTFFFRVTKNGKPSLSAMSNDPDKKKMKESNVWDAPLIEKGRYGLEKMTHDIYDFYYDLKQNTLSFSKLNKRKKRIR